MRLWPRPTVTHGASSVDPLPIPPRPRWRGFSFALHPDTVQGFCFARIQHSPMQAFTTCFVPSMRLYRTRHKIAHRALQWLFLRLRPLNRPRYQIDASDYNTTCATLEGITAPEALNRYRIPPPRRTLHRPAQTVYYNKVYKRADHASGGGSARRLAVWRPPPGRAVQQQERGGRRGTIGGFRRISFRAFAR